MVTNRKVTGKAMSATGGILVGTGISVGITLVGAVLVTWMIDKTYLSENGVGYAVMAVLMIASVSSAMTAISLVKRQKLIIGLVTGVIYLLFLMGLTAFCFGGQYQGVIPTVLLVIGSSAASALILSKREGNRISVGHNRHYG